MPDNSLHIDNKGDPALAVAFSTYSPFFVRDERKRYVVLLYKALMLLHAVETDTNHLCVQFLEFVQVTLERKEFVLSDRGEVGEIEGQHKVLFGLKIRHPERALSGFR